MTAITVNSTQTGTEVLASGDGTTKNVTITAVTTAQSIVLVETSNEDATGRLLRHIWAGALTTTTNLALTRSNSSFANSCTVHWTVLEFDTGVLGSLQTGTLDRTSATATQSITAVDPDKSFILMHMKTSKNSYDLDVACTAQLTQTTSPGDTISTVSAGTPTTGESELQYQVVEFNSTADIDVTQGIIDLTTNESATATVTAVDTTKTFVIHAGVSSNSSSSNSRNACRIALTNSTTITADRTNSGTTAAMTAGYFMCELSGTGHGVEQYSGTIADTASSTTDSWTAQSTTNTVIFSGHNYGNQRTDNTGPSNDPGDIMAIRVLGASADGVTITRGLTVKPTYYNGFSVDFSAGGGASTLTADSGAFTLTGTAAGLSASRQLVGASGTFALTGTAVGLPLGSSLTADSGTFTLSGTAIGLSASRQIAANSGSFALTGTAATLGRGLTLASDTAAFALTGTAATLTYTPAAGEFTLVADSGSFVLSGTAVDLQGDHNLASGSGSFSLSGTNIGFAYGKTLTSDSGSYVLTGTNVALQASRGIIGDSGSFALTGFSAGLSYSGGSIWVDQVEATTTWTDTPETTTTWTDQ